MLPALPKVPRRLFSGLSIRPLLMDILWGLLGQAAARGGVSATLVGLWVSVPLRRRGIAAPSDRNLTLWRRIQSDQRTKLSKLNFGTEQKTSELFIVVSTFPWLLQNYNQVIVHMATGHHFLMNPYHPTTVHCSLHCLLSDWGYLRRHRPWKSRGTVG